MTETTAQQVQKNIQAQVSAWDAQIQRYESLAKSVDEYTKQAFLDELIHIQAKRDAFIEQLVGIRANQLECSTEEAESSWEDVEPDLDELKDIDENGGVDETDELDDRTYSHASHPFKDEFLYPKFLLK